MKHTLIDFAVKMDISPAEAYVLPALFDESASRLGTTRDALIEQVMVNAEAAQYMADLARQVASDHKAS